MQKQKLTLSYVAKDGRTISESRSHPGMFVFESSDGRSFFTVNSTLELIVQYHPPKRYGDVIPFLRPTFKPNDDARL